MGTPGRSSDELHREADEISSRADPSEIINPRKTAQRREDAAMGVSGSTSAPAPAVSMSQAQFSKYPPGGKRSAPPADMLKRQRDN